METRLSLTPGQNGTKKLLARYGELLVCVRYRYDAARKVRHKTVELIVETAPWAPKRRHLAPAAAPVGGGLENGAGARIAGPRGSSGQPLKSIYT